jgi:hypothetical protein
LIFVRAVTVAGLPLEGGPDRIESLGPEDVAAVVHHEFENSPAGRKFDGEEGRPSRS